MVIKESFMILHVSFVISMIFTEETLSRGKEDNISFFFNLETFDFVFSSNCPKGFSALLKCSAECASLRKSFHSFPICCALFIMAFILLMLV